MKKKAPVMNEDVGKKNCKEHKICGREPGGARACEIGICPVAAHEELETLTVATMRTG